jgi:hypothetical protein
MKNTTLVLMVGLLELIILSRCSDKSKFPLDSTGADPRMTVFADDEYNRLFSRCGNGWTGANGACSIPLPDGRTLWLFSDTFLDTVYQNRSRPENARLIKNSFVVEDGKRIITLFRRTAENPKAFITPADTTLWYSPLSGIVCNNELQILAASYKKTGTDAFDFQLIEKLGSS